MVDVEWTHVRPGMFAVSQTACVTGRSARTLVQWAPDHAEDSGAPMRERIIRAMHYPGASHRTVTDAVLAHTGRTAGAQC
jgi:hypothetical protein